MDLSRPYSAISPTIDGDVLVALAGTTRMLTGRDIAGVVRRGSQRSVADALERLSRQGLVHRQVAGRAYLHSLNRAHVLAPVVEQLAAVSNSFIGRLREAFAGWRVPPVHASLFGSAARHEGGLDSDVDLFVVRPVEVDTDDVAWAAQVGELADAVFAWTGNHASISELAESELSDFVASTPPILESLRSDAIDLAGQPLRRLLPRGNVT